MSVASGLLVLAGCAWVLAGVLGAGRFMPVPETADAPKFSASPESADSAALWGFWIGSQVAWVSLLKRGVSGVLCAPGKTTVQEVVGSEGFPLRANGVHQGPLRAYPEPPLCGNISVESCYQN